MKTLTDREKRCEDCACLAIKNGVWCCDECFGQKCDEIDDCPEGITLEEVTAIDEKTKGVKINVGAKAENRKEHAPRERKPDEEKEQIIADTAKFLETMVENVQITNVSKIIEFDFGGNHYKFDLIRQRPKKTAKK